MISTTISKQLRINGLIRVPQVRVIGNAGEQLGVMDTSHALQLAREQDLDLVEVSPVANPPVCKIINYGAYQYQQEKKERKQKVKQKRVEIKGIRLTLKIAPHDLETRKHQATKFLAKGDKVHVEMLLRGREKAHLGRAREMMQQFARSIAEDVIIETPLRQQGGRLSILVAKR